MKCYHTRRVWSELPTNTYMMCTTRSMKVLAEQHRSFFVSAWVEIEVIYNYKCVTVWCPILGRFTSKSRFKQRSNSTQLKNHTHPPQLKFWTRSQSGRPKADFIVALNCIAKVLYNVVWQMQTRKRVIVDFMVVIGTYFPVTKSIPISKRGINSYRQYQAAEWIINAVRMGALIISDIEEEYKIKCYRGYKLFSRGIFKRYFGTGNYRYL